MKLVSAVLDLLYPPKCIFCQKLLPRGVRDWCTPCEKSLPYCDTTREGQFFGRCAAPLEYRGAAREAVLRFKFTGLACYAPALARMMADCIAFARLAQPELVTWVPVSRRRRRRRGYDQAELLAQELGRRLDVPVAGLLVKTVENKTQSSLRAPERRANVLGVYQARQPEAIAGRRILLIDDIITTGATLEECSRVLLSAGARAVDCATAACTPQNTEEDRDVSTDR